MLTELHWIDGPWPGRLAIAARPRGADWVEEELAAWRQMGIDTVVSLLTVDEEQDLDLQNEAREATAHEMEFLSFPVADRQVPSSFAAAASLIERLDAGLAMGKNIAVHCRQGVGRSGLIAASLLVGRGVEPEFAMERVSTARGVPVPETQQQRNWIAHYAETLIPR